MNKICRPVVNVNQPTTDASPRQCDHYLPATLRGLIVEEPEEDLPQMLDAAHEGKIFTEYCLGK